MKSNREGRNDFQHMHGLVCRFFNNFNNLHINLTASVVCMYAHVFLSLHHIQQIQNCYISGLTEKTTIQGFINMECFKTDERKAEPSKKTKLNLHLSWPVVTYVSNSLDQSCTVTY